MITKKIINILLFSSVFFLYMENVNSQENPCNSCGGEGYQTCIRCGGAGNYSCDQCSGAGGRWEVCNCNSGYVTMPDQTVQVCNYCEGEGRKWHLCYNPNCSNGTAFCHFCQGQGNLLCPTCSGTGKQ